MSETVHLASVNTASGTSQAGRKWTRFDLIDDHGTKIGSTFDAALGNAAQAHIGGLIDVDREHDGKGFQVKAVRPSNGAPVTPSQPVSAPPAQQTAPAQSGNFYKPRDPAGSRMIRRQVALKAAAQVCAGREVGTQDVLGLAQSFDSWLAREDVDSESIPF